MREDVATEHVPRRQELKEMEERLLSLSRRITHREDRLYRSENARQEYRRLHRRWVEAKRQLRMDV